MGLVIAVLLGLAALAEAVARSLAAGAVLSVTLLRWTVWLGVALGLPFLVVALTGPGPDTETRSVTVLTAALAPVAAAAALALRDVVAHHISVIAVQAEAMTNARRHAPGAAVDVELHYAGDGLRLRIRDNGPGPPPVPPEGGHGLLGMRERAAAVGGKLTTSTARGGGFLIAARLPGKADTP